MRRINYGNLSFLLTMLLAAAWYISGLWADGASHTIWAVVSAALLPLASATIIYLTDERITSGASGLAPILWFVLATASPAALSFTPLHAATLLLAGALALLLVYTCISQGIGILSLSFVLLASASLMIPPMVWLAPVFIAASAGKSTDKAKYFTTALISLAAPLFVLCCIRYLLKDAEAVGLTLSEFGTGAITLHPLSIGATAPTIARMAVAAVITLLAIVHVAGRLGSYTTVQFHSYLRILVLMPFFLVFAVLFLGGQPYEMVTAMPAALLIDEYAGQSGKKRLTALLLTILALLLAAERIFYYI